jgi:GNAT superfamily N-acetyltransferase
MGKIEIRQFSGRDIEPWLRRMAELRIAVFRDFPYLYDGSFEYEEKYLRTYVETPNSIAILALDGGQAIGVSTGLPMADETDHFQAPFVKLGFDPARIFYCAESVLLPQYRGQGVYKHFFLGREAHARKLGGLDWCCFCGVARPDDHPLRPSDYTPLDAVWRRFGYERHPEIHTTYHWKDIGETSESDHEMVYWMKRLTGGPA